MATRTIMHIDLDAFFVSVEQVLNPDLRGKPVVVGGKPDRRGVVAAASYEARAFGLHSAMPLVTAARLCPQAIFIEGSFPRYRDASKEFMAILADFSPFLEPGGLDEAYLDVTGFESLHGSIHQMALSIKQRVKELSRVPLKALKSHFGASGEMLHGFSNGIDDRKVSAPGVAKSISRETTFDHDIAERPVLEATLRYLSERVGSDLRHRQRQAKCVTLKLRYADFTTVTRRQTLPKTTDADQTIFEIGQALMRRTLTAERQPVRLIGIGVSNLVEPGKQLAMLDSSDRRQEQLNRTIDRIRDRYGFTAIQTGRTLRLRDIFPPGDGDYTLQTPSLSR